MANIGEDQSTLPLSLFCSLPFCLFLCVSGHISLHEITGLCACALQYSKFIKNGWTILDTTQDIWTLAAMYEHDDSNTEMAVVTTNKDSSSTRTNWHFGSMSEDLAVEVYRTSATENCTRLTDAVLPSSGVLKYELPATSVTTFHFVTVPSSAVATAG